MKTFTFADYFYITENLENEILRLQQQITSLEAQKSSRVKPLDDAITRLRTLLAQKQRQQSSQKQQEQRSQTPTTQTTTPGSAGKETPGV